MHCQFCVDVHSQRALAQGASKKEIAEAIAVAMFIAGGSQLGWTNVYGENVYGLIFGEKKVEESEKTKDAVAETDAKTEVPNLPYFLIFLREFLKEDSLICHTFLDRRTIYIVFYAILLEKIMSSDKKE